MTRFVQLDIAVDDPRRADVTEVLREHLRQMHAVTPAEGVFAFGADELTDPSVTFFSARRRGEVVAVGALKHLDAQHAEIKSMHTRRQARGQGVGRALLHHLLDHAAERGYERVSLETGVMEAFEPARSLYAAAGFVVCPPFGPYVGSATSVCMSKELSAPPT